MTAGTCQISAWASRAPGNGAVWAPSMIELGGRFYLFYAAWDPSVGHYCVGVAEGTDPVGPYVDHSTEPVVCQANMGGSIDPDVYQDASGNYYLAWKNNDGLGSTSPATLWSSAVTFDGDGASLSGPTTALLTQNRAWETTIEQPEMVELGGRWILFFSGGPGRPAAMPSPTPTARVRRPLCRPQQHGGVRIGRGRRPDRGRHRSSPTPVGLCGWPTTPGQPATSAIRTVPAVCGWTTVPRRAGHRCCSGRRRHRRRSPRRAPALNDGLPMAATDGGIFSFHTLSWARWVVTLERPGGRHRRRPGRRLLGGGSDGGHLRLRRPVLRIAQPARRCGPPSSAWPRLPTEAGTGRWTARGHSPISASAGNLGSIGGTRWAAPIVAMAAEPGGGGYWEVASDGGIFSFGNARFYGSMGGRRLDDRCGIAPTPDGGGYWEVASDGGVFAFGDARFYGSMGGARLDSR